VTATIAKRPEALLQRDHRRAVVTLAVSPTRVVDYRFEAFDVFIGPSSLWANPFIVGIHGDRARVSARYECWIEGQPDLLARLGDLRGKRLGHEAPHKPCHGHVLAQMADETDFASLAKRLPKAA